MIIYVTNVRIGLNSLFQFSTFVCRSLPVPPANAPKMGRTAMGDVAPVYFARVNHQHAGRRKKVSHCIEILEKNLLKGNVFLLNFADEILQNGANKEGALPWLSG